MLSFCKKINTALLATLETFVPKCIACKKFVYLLADAQYHKVVQVAIFDCNPPAQQSCAGLRSKIATGKAGSR